MRASRDLARVNCATFFIIPNWVRSLSGGFLREMNVVLSREQQQAVNWVATGKVALCVFCRDEFADKAKAQGLPVDSINPNDVKEMPRLQGKRQRHYLC